MRALLVLPLALLLAACGGGDDYAADMHREHGHETPTASPAVAGVDTTRTPGHEVIYAMLDGEPVRGYYVEPRDAEAPRAGLVLFHEWWGLNDNVRMMAHRFADEGYVVLAVDLYDGQVADTPDEAMRLLRESTGRSDALMGTVQQGIRYLNETGGAHGIGTVGWCFGGGWSLETALALPEDVDAAVMYYGEVVTDRARLAPLDAPLLGLFGAADTSIPVADVRAMETALRELDKPVEIHVYDGAGHAFANPSGERYNAAAAEAAWGETTAFLNEAFREIRSR